MIALTAGMSSLYLLVFPGRGLLKIGKADDVLARSRTLMRWWGRADHAASFELKAPRHTVFRLEKSLHFLLSERSVFFDEGDGKTELFSLDALDLALKHLDLFIESGSVPAALQRGIAEPPAKPAPRQPPDLDRWTLADTTRQASRNHDRIRRLVKIALAKQHKWAYQIEVLDRQILLRLQCDKAGFLSDLDDCFALRFPRGWAALGGGRRCDNETWLLDFRIFSFDPSHQSILESFWESMKKLVLQLPKCSPAGERLWGQEKISESDLYLSA